MHKLILRSTKFCRRCCLGLKFYWKLFAIITLTTYFISHLGEVDESVSADLQPTVSRQTFKVLIREKYSRKRPKILLWTSFFGSMSWYEDGNRDFENVCQSNCILTDDKSEIKTADAVVFHLSDITLPGNLLNGFRFQFPKYRRPDQVWILYNLEPITMVLGDFEAWQGVFNWTWSYTSDSDVYAPYGQFRRLSQEETHRRRNMSDKAYDHFQNKTARGGLAIVSNCVDDARRYRLIKYLRKFINIDVYGKCGKPWPENKDLKSSYQFYLALENSDCREYVTEKYWSTLMRNQIPIVAWKLPMDGFVIPNSYINLFDFKDLASAGAYIQRVSENRTLYNSYFNWKTTYKQTFKMGFCTLCEKLKETNRSSQVYPDIHGWLTNSVCQPITIQRFLSRVFDRFMFDGRFF